MHNPGILYPLFTLAAWTGCILLLIPARRFAASARGEVSAADFKLGESPRVPATVSLPNRNYMNLLEAPVLFYVACLLIYLAPENSPTALALAWSYAVLRMIHSGIHLTSNKVLHRMLAFAVSNGVLVALWIVAAKLLLG